MPPQVSVHNRARFMCFNMNAQVSANCHSDVKHTSLHTAVVQYATGWCACFSCPESS